MVSGRFVYLIESHGSEIVNRVIEEMRRLPDMADARILLAPELREWREELIENLGHWLRFANEAELANRYEERGKRRFDEGIPLYDCVQALCLVRRKMVDFVDEQVANKDAMTLYAEEELVRRLARFFDVLIVRFVRGYEQAMRRSAAWPSAAG